MRIRTERPTPALPQLSMNPLYLHHHRLYYLLFLLLLLVPAAQSQNSPSRVDPYTRITFNKTMAAVLIILVVVFFALGFISIYTRQCAERRGRLDLAVTMAGGMERPQQHGLDSEIIDTFPTFVYSQVKSLKIGRTTLECAVCLNEFKDDETLRLIPKCCHVFHPECIDAWLANHSTCPVCRANLAPPRPDDDVDASSNAVIQIPDPAQPNRPNTEPGYEPNYINPVEEEIQRVTITEPPGVNSVEPDRICTRPVRSTSTGFGIARLFPRSHSTGSSLVKPREDFERFTLRLPEEVRNELVSSGSLNRTKSYRVTWQQERSERKDYRTRSVGRSYLQYERFGGENRLDRWGFMWTPPFWGRTGSTKSTRVKDEEDEEERSTDHLFSKK